MGNVWQYILRFGPLVAAFALGLAAVIENFVPGYTAIVNQILVFLGYVGVTPDQNILVELGSLLAGATALVGVARKLWSLIQKYLA